MLSVSRRDDAAMSRIEHDDSHRWITACLAQAVSHRSAIPEQTVWIGRVSQLLKLDSEALPPEVPEHLLYQIAHEIATARGSDHDDDFIEHIVDLNLGLSLNDENTEGKKPVQPAYSAIDRARTLHLLRCIGTAVPRETLERIESLVSSRLFTLYENRDKFDSSSMSATAQGAITGRGRSKLARWATVGAGFIAGGTVVGLTGGLAAPLLGPLIATASGGALAFLASSGGIALVGTLFGLAGGGLSAYRVDRRYKDIEEFEFEQLFEHTQKSDANNREQSDAQITRASERLHPALTVTVVISGLLHNIEDYREPWIPAFSSCSSDVYALKWETKTMTSLGRSVNTFTRNIIAKKGAAALLKQTALAAFYSAVSLPSTIWTVASYTLDNVFQRSVSKAKQAGVLLADTLEKEIQGPRPVTLIGSSMGAIVVYTCLQELARRHTGPNAKVFVFDAVLLSLPLAPSDYDWKMAMSGCSNRLVNVYSKNDWLLALVARIHALGKGVAGLVPVMQPTASEDRAETNSSSYPNAIEGSQASQSSYKDTMDDSHQISQGAERALNLNDDLATSEGSDTMDSTNYSAQAKPTIKLSDKRPFLLNIDASQCLGAHSALVDPKIMQNVWKYVERRMEEAEECK